MNTITLEFKAVKAKIPIEGKKEYFTNSKYLLCPFHLFENLRRALPGKKKTQQRLKKLLEKNKIDKVLSSLKRMIKMLHSRKLKKKLMEFYVYVRNNREGIESSMRVRMDKNLRSAGAVEANIDKLIAHRFKGRGMSWSKQGAQSLLKIRQTIMNNQWDNWWHKERGKKIEIKAVFKEVLTAADMNKRRKITPFIEAELPCYQGPDQSKPWVGILRELTQARQLSWKYRLNMRRKSSNAAISYINQSSIALGELNKYSSYRLVGLR